MRMAGSEGAAVQPRRARTFGTVVCGHWHQLISAPDQGLIVNGCLVGFGESAWPDIELPAPEHPQQGMWLVTPEHGITVSAPGPVADRKTEGW